MSPADDPHAASGAGSSAFADAFTDPLKAAMSFGKFVPGFDFLEQWSRQAQAALPSMGQWVAPTLDPAELEKRIQDLRTVQFWLEQNARMLGMTIQALEVQRMTLTTLQGMNVPLDALRETLQARPSPAPARAASSAPPPSPYAAAPAPRSPHPPAAAPARASSPAPAPAADEGAASAQTPGADAGAPAGPAPVDPMRWWGALTQQFTQLAAHTLQDALSRPSGTGTGTAPGDADHAAAPAAGKGGAAPAAAAPGARAAATAPSSGTPAAGASTADAASRQADAPRTPRAKARGSPGDKPARG